MNTALSPIYPLAKLLKRSTLSKMYTAYMRPYHDYADVVFDGHITTHDELRLERMQNRIARLTTGAPFRTPTNKLRFDIGWETLKTRRETHRLTLFHKLTHFSNTQPNYILSILPQTRISNTNRNLRNANTRTLPANNTTSFQRSFVPKTTRKWNLLPPSTREQIHTPTFKKEVAELLGCSSPPLYFSFGSKLGNCLHTKIRTGTLPLNAYLFQLQKSESSSCRCGFPNEHIRHFVLNCNLYRAQRNILFRKISETLNYDFACLPTEHIFDILLNGTTLHPEDGRRVAECFQSYVQETLALRRVAAGGGGVAAPL